MTDLPLATYGGKALVYAFKSKCYFKQVPKRAGVSF
jgi:hypothetical protein